MGAPDRDLLPLLVVLGLFHLLQHGHGQVYPYGNDPRQPHHVNGTHWDYRSAGQDWSGTDAAGQPWTCLTGRQQSPVHVDPGAATALLPAQQIDWSGLAAVPSSGNNVQITNNGHTVMVTISAAAAAPLPVVRLPLPDDATSPLHMLSNRKRTLSAPAHLQQLHFHTPSEHVVAGVVYPMEMHMVFLIPPTPAISSCPQEGCRMVATVLWELGGEGEDHLQLQKLWQVLPLLEHVRAWRVVGGRV